MSIASTPDMSTCSNIPITSNIFDEASGDFALISSDETIFHVPRAVLQFSSKVFETIFEAGSPSESSTKDTTPIRMQADARHLEMILKLAHPGHISPIISDIVTLAELLRIAKQYEMESVKDQLRVWFMKERIEDGVLLYSIIATKPLAAFVVAISFECVDEARYALKEVIRCDLHQELGACKKYEIPLYLMQYIMKLRAERARWLKTRLRLLSHLALEHDSVVLAQTGHFPPRKDSECVSYMSEYIRWERRASDELDARPSFTNFKALIRDPESGAIAKGLFKDNSLGKLWNALDAFEKSYRVLESALPELDNTLGL